MSQEPDYCCFKYRPIDKRLLDSLVRSALYFPHHAQLNDPFDCSIDINRAISHAIARGECERVDLLERFANDTEVIDRFRAGVAKFGVGAFSLTSTETLLWSHYADDHRGAVLRYDFPKEYLDNEDRFFGVSAVSYGPNPVSAWLSENITLYDQNHFEFVFGLLKKILMSKAPAWSYEKEARIVTPESGELLIPREMLTHVIFGLQTSDQDQSLIRDIISKYYSDVKFGRIVRTEEDFGLGAIET